MDRIEVIRGSFHPDPKARFQGQTMVLHVASKDSVQIVRRTPKDLMTFRICDGPLARYFSDLGDWTRVLTSAAVAGAPAAVANAVLPSFVFGQKTFITWSNALVGAIVATSTLKSERKVVFSASFRDGRSLVARAEERRLMSRLPTIFRAIETGKIAPPPA